MILAGIRRIAIAYVVLFGATVGVAALLGIAFFLVVLSAEKLVVRRAPENVA
jgi:hypothetical protein